MPVRGRYRKMTMSEGVGGAAQRKLPVWETIGNGAKAGFRHFWLLVGVMLVVSVVGVGLLWLLVGPFFTVALNMQAMTASGAGEAAEYARRVNGALFSGRMLVFFVLTFVLQAVTWVVVWRVAVFGAQDAFRGTAEQWLRRMLVSLWRYICMILAVAAFGLIAALVSALGLLMSILLGKVLPHFLVGLIDFASGLVYWIAFILGMFAIAAIAVVSLIGTSCDERTTLRDAYRLLRGNIVRAGGALLLLYVLLLVIFCMAFIALMMIGMLHIPMAADAPSPGDMVHFMGGIYLLEFIVGLPMAVWGIGTCVAIYRFVGGQAPVRDQPAPV